MISIEKLELLDRKVKEAVGLIQSLKEANAELKDENTLLMERIEELEKETRSIQDDQELIEETIQEAIVQLEKAQDASHKSVEHKPTVKPAPVAEPEEEEEVEEETADDENPGYVYQPAAAETDTVAEIYKDEDDGDDDQTDEDDFFSDEEKPAIGDKGKGDELEIF